MGTSLENSRNTHNRDKSNCFPVSIAGNVSQYRWNEREHINTNMQQHHYLRSIAELWMMHFDRDAHNYSLHYRISIYTIPLLTQNRLAMFGSPSHRIIYWVSVSALNTKLESSGSLSLKSEKGKHWERRCYCKILIQESKWNAIFQVYSIFGVQKREKIHKWQGGQHFQATSHPATDVSAINFRCMVSLNKWLRMDGHGPSLKCNFSTNFKI